MNLSSPVVVRVRESTRGSAGVAIVMWSIVMAAAIFAVRANMARHEFELMGVVATFLLGAYLGWRRRLGSIFFAPVVSWMFAWFPLVVAEMIRDGFFKGAVFGVLMATFGWLVIGFVEFISIMAIALPFRLASLLLHRDSDVVIDPPFSFHQ
jgi:hypothetical protein